MKLIKTLTLVILLVGITLGQQKLAQTGFKFLQMPTDGKISALAGAVTALEGNSSAVFGNPASMARIENSFDANFGNVRYIADINYYYGVIAYTPERGSYGVFALSTVFVDYGEMYRTIPDPTNIYFPYKDLGTFKPYGIAVGLSYAKALSDKFSIGGNLKYAKMDYGEATINVVNGQNVNKKFTANTFVFDFGMLYHTGFQSLDFAASFKNFSPDIQVERESFQAPLCLTIGLAYNLADLFELKKDEHSLQMSLDFSKPRDYKEQVNVGLDYTFAKMISLRLGYSAPNDEHWFTYGLGINYNGIGINYSYVPWKNKAFTDVQQISVNIAF
ncbi:MAG TPA: PorV/PorQ family protein [Ignavibacteriales bacterium]|nr:PorV/PorQ family protein [Ignavibacteriales bacterium]HOM66241.1 PorV/PorQ family protein [Ignavibacteriales bacterium]HPD68388.1 PorV/PorQ family protein [Ignavibacteriales bacterium]HPP34378.1 PorV/PorQ family protein [Ignavibacteriales bacterium]HRR19495.1 PorV/PorQ family protein [Ignavibacteriales bacterium]